MRLTVVQALLVLAYVSAALHHFGIALWATTKLFRLEWNAPPGGTCYRYSERYRGEGIQVTKCTEESAACLALPLHAAWRDDLLVPACNEAVSCDIVATFPIYCSSNELTLQ